MVKAITRQSKQKSAAMQTSTDAEGEYENDEKVARSEALHPDLAPILG